MNEEARLAVIEEKIDGLKTQQSRFFSHFQSEERARDDLKDRVARLEERADSNRWSLQSVMSIISTLAAIAALVIMALKDKA